MRKLIGFILLCLCLSNFYYRYSQLVYETVGEKVALQQLQLIDQEMNKHFQAKGAYTYNLAVLGIDVLPGQSFGFKETCFVDPKNTQSQLFFKTKDESPLYSKGFESRMDISVIINQFATCARDSYTAVVTHKFLNRLGIYTIDQNHQVEIIRSSSLSFLKWLQLFFRPLQD